MKIERISDNQIRCTLTAKDLEERHIRLSELAYGSEKAKALFRDLLAVAMREYGFSNEQNIPLMIEAVPDRGNQLILTITKVEDPEELDTRFARFSATKEVADSEDVPEITGADDILDVFRKLKSTLKNAAKAAADAASSDKEAKTGVALPGKAQAAAGRSEGNVPGKIPETAGRSEGNAQGKVPEAAGRAEGNVPGKAPIPRPRLSKTARNADIHLARLYSFSELDSLIDAATALRGFYKGKNSLYRIASTGEYRLSVHQSGHTPEDFNRICNVLSEYGRGSSWSGPAEAHLKEQETCVIARDALQKLAALRPDPEPKEPEAAPSGTGKEAPDTATERESLTV